MLHHQPSRQAERFRGNIPAMELMCLRRSGPCPHWILYDIADHHPRSSSGWAGVQNGFRLSIQIMLAAAVRDGGALTHG